MGDAYAEIGSFLDGTEAARLAAGLAAGFTTGKALSGISPARRDATATMLGRAGLGHQNPELTVAVLRGIAGARGPRPDGTIGRATVTPVWTMPGAAATSGRLTSQARRMVEQARMSVVCSSYNFAADSQMWGLLRDAAARPGVAVSLYLDAAKGKPQTAATELAGVTVWATCAPLVNHAKFVIVDRALILLTSANFSYHAEHRNIELGLLVHDTTLAGAIEAELTAQHGTTYEMVGPAGP
jgi:hypothetical protein